MDDFMLDVCLEDLLGDDEFAKEEAKEQYYSMNRGNE